MDKLKEAGLYMSALVPLRGAMVERYNKCLALLGLEPTQETAINIDAMGWSPEVALEKGNNYYLNHGGANPYGIILSPLQKGKPVYFPYHSFDRILMDMFFEHNEVAIADITTDSGIVVNLDQNIDAFYEPSDLIDYQTVTVGFDVIDSLDAEQAKQKKLVDKMYEGNNCLSMTLHSKILASANKYGDLRKRKLTLQEVDYKTSSFYTKAFGGVFVFRNDPSGHLLVFESQEEITKYKHSYAALHISEPNLIDNLVDRGYLKFDPSALDPKRVERIANGYFVKHLGDAEHSVAEILQSKTLYKKYFNELNQEQKHESLGSLRYIEKLEKGHEPDISTYLTPDVHMALHQPANDDLQEIIWILLCRMQPSDPYLTYYYDKELFYKEFKNYDPSYKEYIVDLITKELKAKT